MKYEMLGPLRVADGAGYSFISARKIETVLAVLLIRSNQVVTLDQLIDEIWGTHPPRRATAGLHVYISQLRKFLQRPGFPEFAIATRPPGYLLHTGKEDIDFRVFLKLIDQGRTLMQDQRHEDARDRFQEALSLWRGPVLGDVRAGPLIEGFTAWLMEARLECMELLTDAQLELSRHREVVGGLYSAIAENPFRESFYRQLMLALYRSERQADALKVYQLARATLNKELGLEPCRALRELHHAILTADDRLLDVRLPNRR